MSISMVVAFFYWETRIPVEQASIPPQTWSYNNFSVLFTVALVPFLWQATFFFIFTTLWQNVFHWSVISTIVPDWYNRVRSQFHRTIVSILLAFGGGQPEDYWTYVFPALVLGGSGVMLTFVHTNIAIFQAAPLSMSGTVGAIFTCALQCGSAIGIACITSIETSVEATHGGPQEYAGRAASFWFLFGITTLEFISVSIFYDRSTDHKPQPSHNMPLNPAQHITPSDEKLDNAHVTTLEVNQKVDEGDLLV
ncbi:hypothetical protein AZE42_10237 [Rhizopogon vesiculosus]|uniref:Major facilitator superfamily (MFS) profile domain-containing protein n=1 Tax=Rhizopogon vesiculosus TaxID=180088 RepID=A0A1J8Q3G9_9AGAM|nr:hypothetical protein AZE42_10237 [Rhizopogon vesiculosus]